MKIYLSFFLKDLQARVKAYLMDTFDKGFGFADTQWTVEQLEYRLNLISEILRNRSQEVHVAVNCEKSSNEAVNHNLPAQMKPNDILVCKLEFIQVANAFSKAKKAFTTQPSRSGKFRWQSNNCQWTDDINSLHEKKHMDILTCFNPDFQWSMLVIFDCYIDSCANVIKLSVGTIIDGLTILLPVARCTGKVEPEMIDNRFSDELNTLIELVFGGQHSMVNPR